jgi:predicted pyridoxine 5'-phosphate oxidase superfamily flavin-nucleotide-binding protein
MAVVQDALQRVSSDERARLLRNNVTSIEALHELNGTPHVAILEKHTTYLTPLLAQFIEMSPLFMLGTANADGSVDVSPRGDPPGSVKILDSRTIFFADRAGNRRLDSQHREPTVCGTLFRGAAGGRTGADQRAGNDYL